MNAVIPLKYRDHQVRFNLDGWINATDIAKHFGKEPTQWLRQSSTVEYLVKLAEFLEINSVLRTEFNKFKKLKAGTAAYKTLALKLAKATGLVEVDAGRHGGTWLHPKMAVRFARWLSVDFEIWCDMQIDRLLSGDSLTKQRLHASFAAMNEQARKGSAAGRELALHKYKMPALAHSHECLMRQAQLQLNLEGGA
ncbi:KilA-N domain-containing protein [Halomonas piscis]|uniref:KilA-N domain-containing protein n=1 Tax=Halomonas piscis TaxID=3031727 RepID=UPI00289C7BBE|nr:KilA-N domain-containing protein [Halomonas piscis]